MIISQKHTISGTVVNVDFTSLKRPGTLSHVIVGVDVKPTSNDKIFVYLVTDGLEIELDESVNPSGNSFENGHTYAPNIPMPLSKDETIKVRYANPQSRNVTVVFKGSDDIRY